MHPCYGDKKGEAFYIPLQNWSKYDAASLVFFVRTNMCGDNLREGQNSRGKFWYGQIFKFTCKKKSGDPKPENRIIYRSASRLRNGTYNLAIFSACLQQESTDLLIF